MRSHPCPSLDMLKFYSFGPFLAPLRDFNANTMNSFSFASTEKGCDLDIINMLYFCEATKHKYDSYMSEIIFNFMTGKDFSLRFHKSYNRTLQVSAHCSSESCEGCWCHLVLWPQSKASFMAFSRKCQGRNHEYLGNNRYCKGKNNALVIIHLFGPSKGYDKQHGEAIKTSLSNMLVFLHKFR